MSASNGDIKETTLSENSELTSMGSDAKLEKKVTFARLLNKVSAEMSSGSEVISNLYHAIRVKITLPYILDHKQRSGPTGWSSPSPGQLYAALSM